ncbi:MAG: type II toxin-antitoxin system VapC family toxin [Actinomycetota bacterium]
MKLTDVNLLLYAVDASAPRHGASRRWLEEQLSGTETLAFAWVVLIAFLRLSTNPSVFDDPLELAEAFDMVDEWLAQPPSTVVHPTDRHGAVLRDLLEPLGTAGNLTTDAHLAALAVEHGAELCSSDADFSRFPGVRWRNPLAQS